MAALKEVIWSKECYTPRTLLAQFGTRLPVIAKISSGYCPITPDDTLQSSEMVRIHSWVNQKRVLARDLRGRLLSIPEDYLIKFEVVGQQKKHNNRAKKLKDVITKFHLPLTVRFDTKTRWKFRVGDEVYESSTFGQMQLVKSYVDTYLRTNPIRNGVISTRVLLFPVSIEATMNVAQGSRNSTPAEWATHLDMYTKALKARGVRFDKVRGVIDITVFSKETNNDVLVDGNSSGVLADGNTSPDIPMPPLTNGNGVKAPAAPPSEHEEYMTQTSASSSGGTTIEANSSMERSVIDANSSIATSVIDANSSMTTSEVMGMSFQGRGSDTSSQYIARVHVAKESGASPTDVSGPIAQMEELHLQPVMVEYNGNAAMNSEGVVRSGRQRTYSDGAIGERVWKEKTQRSCPSTLHGHAGGGHHHSGGGHHHTVGGHHHRSEKQQRVHKKHESRHHSVITRKVQSADVNRQGYYSVENVRYEQPPPLMHPTTRRAVLPEGHTTFVPDSGSRIGVGRVSASSHHAAPRHYQSMQEVYNDNNLQIGIVSNQAPVYYRDFYRYNDSYEPMYVRQDPVPRQQVRLQQVRRNTTMPTGGYRYVNRYYDDSVTTPDYEQGYYEQRIISRPPRDYEYFEGDGRASSLGQVTVHGPGLLTTGGHRIMSPRSYSSGRTWMYSEDDRNDIVGREEQVFIR